ncbi:rhodanese-like domain-containing protein [Methylomagnum sp.]
MNPNDILKLANDARTRIREISPAEYDTAVVAGATVIDVREDGEFRAGHLPGAIHISRSQLEARINSAVADSTDPIVVYCAIGHRSAIAADTLQKRGYTHVASLAGGLNAYLAASTTRKSA